MRSQAQQRIPNRFFFVYGLQPRQEPFHLIHYLCLRSCLETNQPERITLCSPDEPYGRYWNLIKSEVEHVKIEPIPQVTGFQYPDRGIDPYRYAHHSDFIRLDQLLEHGGGYADLDTLFVKPLPSTLFEKPFVLGRERDIADPHSGQLTPSLCNAFIMSAPGAAFCHRWRAAMDAAFDGTWSNHSTLLPQRLAHRHPEEIHIEPECAFFPFPPTTEGLSLLFDTTATVPNKTYSIHLWAHLWWSDRRVDFSPFDAGRVTETFVREVDTTYTVAARPFLPKTRSWGTFEPLRRRICAASAEINRALTRRREEARALLRLTRLALRRQESVGSDSLRATQKRVLTFHRACQKLKVRDGFEEAILDSVILADEYGLGARRLVASDVVIDIGAHIGAFSLLCHSLGSRGVFAFEPDPRNYARLNRNLSAVKGIQVDSRAVFRSDCRDIGTQLVHSGPHGVNTGGGNVIMGGLEFAPINQEAWSLPEQTSTVETIPLDDVLRRFDRVALLKLDCEGSEFPILLTSRELGRVDEIVGEYHEVGPELMPQVDPAARIGTVKSYSAVLLGAKLQAAGFKVQFSRTHLNMGSFRAVRRGKR